MFGSSFSASLPPANSSSSSTSTSHKHKKSAGFAFQSSSSATSTSSSTSSATGTSSSLPFTGFAGGFGSAGASKPATGGAAGGFGFGSSGGGGGSSPLKHKHKTSSAPATNAVAASTSTSNASPGSASFGFAAANAAGITMNKASSGGGGAPSFGANMFSAGGGSGGGGSSSSQGSSKRSATGTSTFSVNASAAAPAGLPFGGFSGGMGVMSPSSSKSGGSGKSKRTAGISFSGAAAAAAPSFSGAAAAQSAAAAFSGQSAAPSSSSSPAAAFSGASASAAASMSNALVPIASTAITIANARSPPSSSSSNKNNNLSVENSCISTDGRSFHSYIYDSSLGKHVIVSEFAPFGDASSANNGPRDTNGNIISSLKVTTSLPSSIVESLNIDPIIGLICVDGGNDDGAKSKRRRQFKESDGSSKKPMTTLPWMCLYTRTSAFLLSIGHEQPDKEDDGPHDINGTILHVVEPFEKQLLTSPRGSSILRIRSAPTSGSMFHRCGSMALLMREGGENGDGDGDSVVGYVVMLYHGLPESLLGSSSNKFGADLGGRSNPTGEGSVTVPLRFDKEDLVRGMEDTIDAENEAYNISSRDQPPPSSSGTSGAKAVVDFCFMNPSISNNSSGGSGFSATSVLVLCNDGSVYGASPVLFDGTVLPRSVVVDAISHLDGEIEASTNYLKSFASSPVPTFEQESVEARTKQCRAARKYLSDAFGIPEGMLQQQDDGRVGMTRPMQGSYYVSASVVHSRSYSSSHDGRFSQALAWQPRLQGPLVMPPQQLEDQETDSTSPLPQYQCIESFGGAAGGGIVDGFVVLRDCKSDNSQAKSSSLIHVEFGILPGEGAVILPRFEFESDADCRLIDELVCGTGMYVERATIMDDKGNSEESGGVPPRRGSSISSNGRDCSIVVDPLDDIMIHVMTRSRIATVTTNAVALTANCFKSQMGESSSSRKRGGNEDMSSIRTKVWSGLEVNSSDAALIGARVSGDVHLGHILLAKVSNGSMEVVNITAAQVLHETSEQMKAKSEQLAGDDEALQVLKRVQPLHELLQPLIDKVCDGLSKMGKLVGGATLPKDAGPENLAVFLDTQNTCEENVLVPMEEMSKIIGARRELLKELYDHQAAELIRLTALLDEFKQKYESNLKKVIELETNAAVLAERSSAVLTATRDLRPQITDAEAAYFKDLKRYETSCNKWDGTVDTLQKDTTTSCNAMSAGAIENGEVHCLVDLPPQNIEVCHKLLRGEGLLLNQIEKQVKESSAVVKRLSKTITSGMDTADAARLRIVGGDKENQRR